jgi:hypothetical protein
MATFPAETILQLRDGYAQEIMTELDLKAAGISSILWARGYDFDFSLVKLRDKRAGRLLIAPDLK